MLICVKAFTNFPFTSGFFKWFGNLIYVLMVFSCQSLVKYGKGERELENQRQREREREKERDRENKGCGNGWARRRRGPKREWRNNVDVEKVVAKELLKLQSINKWTSTFDKRYQHIPFEMWIARIPTVIMMCSGTKFAIHYMYFVFFSSSRSFF